MPTRNHPDDQRTDSLVYHLSVLTQSVTVALATLEYLLETPDSLVHNQVTFLGMIRCASHSQS